MDVDKEFVQSVLKGGVPAYVLAHDRGITPDHLEGEGRTAWEYVVGHKKEYGSLPSADIIFGKIGIDLPVLPSDGFRFWIDEILNRRLYRTLRGGAEDITKKLDSRDPKGAAEAWTEIHRKLQRERLSVSKVESLLALGKEVIQYYDNVKMGIKGIPTPWPTMTKQTMGWWPEDLVLFIGRLGMGKTWTLVLTAHCAWSAGKKVLFISTEMNKVRMAMRFFALHFRLSYDDLRNGKLGEFVEQKFKANVTAILEGTGMMIVGGGFNFSIDNVEAAIEESECDIAAIDGPYLIKNTGKDRHERVSNTFDDLKRISKLRKIVTLSNSQFNRQAKKGEASTIASENIGITDVAGWNMDCGFGLHQTDDMRDNCQMGWKPIKIREGKPIEFHSRWDLDRMDFAEINEDGTDKPPSDDDGNREPGSDDLEPGASHFSDDHSDLPF